MTYALTLGGNQKQKCAFMMGRADVVMCRQGERNVNRVMVHESSQGLGINLSLQETEGKPRTQKGR